MRLERLFCFLSIVSTHQAFQACRTLLSTVCHHLVKSHKNTFIPITLLKWKQTTLIVYPPSIFKVLLLVLLSKDNQITLLSTVPTIYNIGHFILLSKVISVVPTSTIFSLLGTSYIVLFDKWE